MKYLTPHMSLTTYSKTFFYLSAAALLILGCGRAKEKTTENELSGRFVNDTFLQAIPDSIPGLVPAFCYEMNFKGDSVQIFFGFEEATFAYTKKGNNYMIVKAMQDKDMPFKLNEDQTITLIDTAWNKNSKTSLFKKSINGDGQTWDFDSYINQQMIAGEYVLYTNGQPTEQKVSFQSDGIVKGMEPYTSYSVCYSGDCVGETYPISNNITFTGPSKETMTYAFIKSKKEKKIGIHHIEAPIKDMKGERAVKELAFDLRQP